MKYRNVFNIAGANRLATLRFVCGVGGLNTALRSLGPVDHFPLTVQDMLIERMLDALLPLWSLRIEGNGRLPLSLWKLVPAGMPELVAVPAPSLYVAPCDPYASIAFHTNHTAPLCWLFAASARYDDVMLTLGSHGPTEEFSITAQGGVEVVPDWRANV